MNDKTTDDSLILENSLISYEATENFELQTSVLTSQMKTQTPLLPRSGWQNRHAFLKVLIKAKQSLDIAEITAFLD